jgi:hypothetical protein
VTPEEGIRMFYLCQRIAAERDRSVFIELVRELSDLLNRQDNRLTGADQQQSA